MMSGHRQPFHRHSSKYCVDMQLVILQIDHIISLLWWLPGLLQRLLTRRCFASQQCRGASNLGRSTHHGEGPDREGTEWLVLWPYEHFILLENVYVDFVRCHYHATTQGLVPKSTSRIKFPIRVRYQVLRLTKKQRLAGQIEGLGTCSMKGCRHRTTLCKTARR